MGLNINLGGFRQSTDQNPGKTIFFAATFTFISLAMLGYGYTQYQGQSESINNAVKINATVAETDIRTDSSRRGGPDYQAEISFDYRYDDSNYSSNFIYPLDDDKEFETESEAQEYLETYSNGRNVEAFVNPDEPGKAFLNAERSDQPLLLILIGGLMSLLGGYKVLKTVIY